MTYTILRCQTLKTKLASHMCPSVAHIKSVFRSVLGSTVQAVWGIPPAESMEVGCEPTVLQKERGEVVVHLARSRLDPWLSPRNQTSHPGCSVWGHHPISLAIPSRTICGDQVLLCSCHLFSVQLNGDCTHYHLNSQTIFVYLQTYHFLQMYKWFDFLGIVILCDVSFWFASVLYKENIYTYFTIFLLFQQ